MRIMYIYKRIVFEWRFYNLHLRFNKLIFANHIHILYIFFKGILSWKTIVPTIWKSSRTWYAILHENESESRKPRKQFEFFVHLRCNEWIRRKRTKTPGCRLYCNHSIIAFLYHFIIFFFRNVGSRVTSKKYDN